MGQPFEVLEPLGGTRARVRFIGTFQAREVVWNATLVTLDRAYRDWLAGDGALAHSAGMRQCIDVGAEEPEGFALTVALKVPVIDEPTVWKTVIMVRNFKRLNRGRHEWGEEPYFPAGS